MPHQNSSYSTFVGCQRTCGVWKWTACKTKLQNLSGACLLQPADFSWTWRRKERKSLLYNYTVRQRCELQQRRAAKSHTVICVWVSDRCHNSHHTLPVTYSRNSCSQMYVCNLWFMCVCALAMCLFVCECMQVFVRVLHLLLHIYFYVLVGICSCLSECIREALFLVLRQFVE